MNRTTVIIVFLLCVVLFAVQGGAQTQPNNDVLGVHDLGSPASPLHGSNANACAYCHAPHNASSNPQLWNQTLSTQQYQLYPGTSQNPGTATSVNPRSALCLSCHDGTVAVGQTLAIGTLQMIGAINPSGKMTDNMGTQLKGSHPFSIQPQLKDAPTLVSTLVASHQTKDPLVPLTDNNIECSTCHDVHNQYKDLKNQKFLIRENSESKLCMACHDTGARTVNNRDNVLTAWPNSVHAKATTAALAPKAGFGGYANVSEVGCSICHGAHNALGDGLLRTNPNRAQLKNALVDDLSQACMTCHDGSDNLVQPILNVADLFQASAPDGPTSHPFADSSNAHTMTEATVLDQNRHTTCADCHAPHAAQPTTSFPSTPNVRPSQIGVPGVAVDGTQVKSATYQYETCMRCHGTSTGKQSLPAYGYMPARAMFAGDTLNVALQFNNTALSAHPVMRDATNLARLSLLKNMWNEDFTIAGRAMTSRILCTDCHNSDKNREFGGNGANGPHGSANSHILERRYIMSKVNPGDVGGQIINLNANPILTGAGSPYALCAKCHDLNYINTDATWGNHSKHINKGVSCSVCHSSHGVPAGTSGTTGRALISFDMNVVASNGGQPVSYNGSGCNLTCHGRPHTQN